MRKQTISVQALKLICCFASSLSHPDSLNPQAPCEAEAQCAELQKKGKVYAVGTEDMDALTFGTKVLLRHLTFSEARKMSIQEFHLDILLKEMDLTIEEVSLTRVQNFLNFMHIMKL